MTVTLLSPQAVKVQLSAEELHMLLPGFPDAPDSGTPPESPQLLRLLSFLLTRAESATGLPLSSAPVNVELLTVPEGGLAVYFSLRGNVQESKHTAPRSVQFAARFAEPDTLGACCRQLERYREAVRSSMLYRYQSAYVFTVRVERERAPAVHHLLLEYGRPFRLNALNRARLSEYGRCLCGRDAIQYAAGMQ